MQVISVSNKSVTIQAEDGRVITVTEGVPVTIFPVDIQPVTTDSPSPDVQPAVEPEAVPAPEATPVAPDVSAPVDPVVDPTAS